MKKRNRMLWTILFGVPALIVLPLALVGSSVMTAGSIDISVVEKNGGGSSVGIHIPALLAPAAVHLMPEVTVDDIRMEMGPEARQALVLAGAVIGELEKLPDAVFVDVMDDTDIVTIEKRSGRLHIYVDTPDETVKIEVPLRAVRQTLKALEAKGLDAA